MDEAGGFLTRVDKYTNFIDTIESIITKNCVCSNGWYYNSDNANMNYNIYEKFLEFANFLNIKNIQFSGGEPILNNNLLEFAKIDSNKKFDNRLKTNFSFRKFSPNFMEEILKNFSHIYISLDGDYLGEFLSKSEKNDNTKADFIGTLSYENFKIIKYNLDLLFKIKNKSNYKNKIIIITNVREQNIKELPNLLNIVNSYKDIRWDIIQDVAAGKRESFLKEAVDIAKRSSNVVKIKPASFARSLKVDVDGSIILINNTKTVIGNCQDIDDYRNIKNKLNEKAKENNGLYAEYYFIPSNIVKKECIW